MIPPSTPSCLVSKLLLMSEYIFSTPSLKCESTLFSYFDPGYHQELQLTTRKLVEIIPALQTSSETLERAKAFGKACKKGRSYNFTSCPFPFRPFWPF